jgi:hypothetical protein
MQFAEHSRKKIAIDFLAAGSLYNGLTLGVLEPFS